MLAWVLKACRSAACWSAKLRTHDPLRHLAYLNVVCKRGFMSLGKFDIPQRHSLLVCAGGGEKLD